MTINYFENKIIFSTSKLPFLALGAISVMFFVIVFLFHKKFQHNPEPIKHLLIGMGIIFAGGALLFRFYSKNIKITLNDPAGKIYLEETLQGNTVNTLISLNDFQRIDIYEVISTKNKEKAQISYELNLISKTETPHKLIEFQTFTKVRKFIDAFVKINNLPINIYMSEKFKKNIDTANYNQQVMVIYNTPFENWKNIDTQNLIINRLTTGYDLPENSILEVNQTENKTEFKWAIRSNLVGIILFLGVLSGFMYLFLAVFIPKYGWIASTIIGFCFNIILLCLGIFSLIYVLFGHPRLTLDNKQIHAETLIFGKQISKQSFQYDDIRLIWNSINSNDQNTITLYSSDGLEQIFNFYKQSANDFDMMQIIGLIMNLRHYVMTIDTQALSYPERLYIEQQIINRIASSNIQ